MTTRIDMLINRMDETDPNWITVTRQEIADGCITLENVDETAEMDLSLLVNIGWDADCLPTVAEMVETIRAMLAESVDTN